MRILLAETNAEKPVCCPFSSVALGCLGLLIDFSFRLSASIVIGCLLRHTDSSLVRLDPQRLAGSIVNGTVEESSYLIGCRFRSTCTFIRMAFIITRLPRPASIMFACCFAPSLLVVPNIPYRKSQVELLMTSVLLDTDCMACLPYTLHLQ